MPYKNNLPDFNEIVIFKPSSGETEFEVIFDGKEDTVWVSRQQMMELFEKARRTIGGHIQNIYKEGELDKDSTWREYRQVQKEGNRKSTRNIDFYNLDRRMISVAFKNGWSIKN